MYHSSIVQLIQRCPTKATWRPSHCLVNRSAGVVLAKTTFVHHERQLHNEARHRYHAAARLASPGPGEGCRSCGSASAIACIIVAAQRGRSRTGRLLPPAGHSADKAQRMPGPHVVAKDTVPIQLLLSRYGPPRAGSCQAR